MCSRQDTLLRGCVVGGIAVVVADAYPLRPVSPSDPGAGRANLSAVARSRRPGLAGQGVSSPCRGTMQTKRRVSSPVFTS